MILRTDCGRLSALFILLMLVSLAHVAAALRSGDRHCLQYVFLITALVPAERPPGGGAYPVKLDIKARKFLIVMT